MSLPTWCTRQRLSVTAAIALWGLVLVPVSGRARQSQAPPPTSSSPRPTSSSPSPTFTLGVDYIEVDALVTDKQGNFVRGLTKNDFQIFEDGKLQTISAFSQIDIPTEQTEPAEQPLKTTAAIQADVASNAEPFDGRVYVMVVDDLHIQPGEVELLKKAADQFIDQDLGANDLMAIVHTAGAQNANQELTSNKQLLHAAVAKTTGRGLRAAVDNQADRAASFNPVLGGNPITDRDDQERLADAMATLQTLRKVASRFANVHNRRRAILFVSQGIDYDVLNMAIGATLTTHTGADDVIAATGEVVGAATRANVAIYGIDPRGLTSLATDDITGQYSRVQLSPKIGEPNAGQHDAIQLSQDSLRTLVG